MEMALAQSSSRCLKVGFACAPQCVWKDGAAPEGAVHWGYLGSADWQLQNRVQHREYGP